MFCKQSLLSQMSFAYARISAINDRDRLQSDKWEGKRLMWRCHREAVGFTHKKRILKTQGYVLFLIGYFKNMLFIAVHLVRPLVDTLSTKIEVKQ